MPLEATVTQTEERSTIDDGVTWVWLCIVAKLTPVRKTIS